MKKKNYCDMTLLLIHSDHLKRLVNNQSRRLCYSSPSPRGYYNSINQLYKTHIFLTIDVY